MAPSSDYTAGLWFTCHCRVLEDESRRLEVVSVSLAPLLPHSQSPPGMKEVGSRHICHPQRYSEVKNLINNTSAASVCHRYYVSITQTCVLTTWHLLKESVKDFKLLLISDTFHLSLRKWLRLQIALHRSCHNSYYTQFLQCSLFLDK